MSQVAIMRVYKLEAQIFDTYANNEDREKTGCIWIKCLRDGGREEESLHLHMPYDAAQAYASAINTCNDRETAEQSWEEKGLVDPYTGQA